MKERFTEFYAINQKILIVAKDTNSDKVTTQVVEGFQNAKLAFLKAFRGEELPEGTLKDIKESFEDFLCWHQSEDGRPVLHDAFGGDIEAAAVILPANA